MEVLCVALLAAALLFAVTRPRGLPEAACSVPAALLLVAVGAISPDTAWQEMSSLGWTVAFLAVVLVLSQMCEREGLFEAAGHAMARRADGRPRRLLGLVFVAAALTTAVLSLDATVVLLTPVVFHTAHRVGARPLPHVYATAHLANSASLLLPVSNLTNLLAMQASGLGFVGFAVLMLAPWLVALAVEYAVFRWFFAGDLAAREAPDEPADPVRTPRFALAVLGLVLAGFVACSPFGVPVVWPALAGVVLLAGRRLLTGQARGEELRQLAGSLNLWFVAFVLSLGVLVRAVVDHGLADAVGHLVPRGDGLPSLLALALGAALLANLVNNLPAVLVLLPLVAASGPVAVLAVLIGVNVGPNLTYVGSLATLLWRRIVADHEHSTQVGTFTRLGLLTTPASLVLCTVALWASARVLGVG